MATKTCKNGFKKSPCRKAKKGAAKSCPKGVVKSGPRKGKCKKVRRSRKS
jgi:hypothetical protein